MLKSKRYENKKYLKAARGQSCTLRLTVCDYNPETTVACHNPFVGSGMGTKSGDDNICFGCHMCHAVLDNRIQSRYSREELKEIFETARYLTHVKLAEMGVMPKDEIGKVR